MKKLKNIFTNNLSKKILSFLIALILWIFIYNYNDPVITKTFYNIPVTILNENSLTEINKVYKIVEGDIIDIKIKGKQSVVNSLKSSDIIATADLSKLSEVNAVRINVNIKGTYKDSLEIIYGSKDTLKVDLDDFVEKFFKVEIVETGELDKNYYIKSKETDFQTVKISGPKKLISRIDKVIIESNLSNVKPDYSTDCNIKILDNYGTLINKSELTMNIDKINIKYEVLETKDIPIKISLSGTAPYGYDLKGYEVNISKIKIAGNKEDLKEIKSLNLSYNISNLKENKTIEFDIQKKLGDKFLNISEKDIVKLKIFIEKLQIKDYFVGINEIKIQNIPANMELLFIDNYITLKIMGKESILKDIKVSTLNPYIDLKDTVIGINEIAVKIYDLDNIELVNDPVLLIELKELNKQNEETFPTVENEIIEEENSEEDEIIKEEDEIDISIEEIIENKDKIKLNNNVVAE